jgi:hypothetical protein
MPWDDCKSRSKSDRVAMTPELRAIAEEIASQADDFLAGAKDRNQGRAGIAELLAMDYSSLDPAERTAVTNGVMRILEAEDFFGAEYVGDPFTDPDEADES